MHVLISISSDNRCNTILIIDLKLVLLFFNFSLSVVGRLILSVLSQYIKRRPLYVRRCNIFAKVIVMLLGLNILFKKYTY